MRSLLLPVFVICFIQSALSQTATNIAAEYHDGQIFITWDNIPGADTGFYYVYRNSVPITSSNIQTSTYLGRVEYNSSYDFRITFASRNEENPRYFVINDNPRKELAPDEGFYVMNCTVNNAPTYFAVRCDYGNTSPNWQVVPGSNATTAGVVQHLDPIRAYWQTRLSAGTANDSMEIYVHYGGKVAVGNYPAMANEGMLSFHFGVMMDGPLGQHIPLYGKFHGGNGDLMQAAITSELGNCWKMSFDDWIPAWNYEDKGINTRWFGYHEGIDIYTFNSNTPPPTSGIIKAYTFKRVTWEIDWVIDNWPGTIDTTRIYLTGASQGCGGVLIHSMVEPWKYAGVTMPDGKYNLASPDDSNPDCKYNEGNAGRRDCRVIWGNEQTSNLYTDLVMPNSTEYYQIYNMSNTSYMLDINQNYALPYIYALNGKNDKTTCWEEKVPVYNAVQTFRAGGNYLWDLRGHGGGNNAWPGLRLELLSRFATNISYPAFSFGTLDGDPGEPVNPEPPYYSGDSVGSLHEAYDWDETTLKDSLTFWQAELFIGQDTMQDGSLIPDTLPKSSKVDVTIKRAQRFKGFPKQTVLYWVTLHNGDTIKTGTVVQRYKGSIPKPLTIKKVKVFPDGTILRVQTTPFQKTAVKSPPKSLAVTAYPNPFSAQLNAEFELMQEETISIVITDLLGKKVYEKNNYEGLEGKNFLSVETGSWSPGIYLMHLLTEEGTQTVKMEKL